jgi:SAM-dependent methyltransferase
MGLYRDHVLPRLVDRACNSQGLQGWRAEVTSGLDGQAIALPDASCDAALSTFTLCTVADPAKVLAGLRRVLRSEGRFHFLEHGIAPEPSVARWQRRLDPWQRRLADGCHLTRNTLALVGQAGFVVERYEQGYAAGPKPWSYFTMGLAVNRE